MEIGQDTEQPELLQMTWIQTIVDPTTAICLHNLAAESKTHPNDLSTKLVTEGIPEIAAEISAGGASPLESPVGLLLATSHQKDQILERLECTNEQLMRSLLVPSSCNSSVIVTVEEPLEALLCDHAAINQLSVSELISKLLQALVLRVAMKRALVSLGIRREASSIDTGETFAEQSAPDGRSKRLVQTAMHDLATEQSLELRHGYTVELCVHLSTGEIIRVLELVPRTADMLLVVGESADGEQRRITMAVESFQYEIATVAWEVSEGSSVH